MVLLQSLESRSQILQTSLGDLAHVTLDSNVSIPLTFGHSNTVNALSESQTATPFQCPAFSSFIWDDSLAILGNVSEARSEYPSLELSPSPYLTPIRDKVLPW